METELKQRETRLPERSRLLSTLEWRRYFEKNLEELIEIPWQLGADASQFELAPIIVSLQAWQLGESSDGSHLMRASGSYAKSINDAEFLEVAKLFIKEEQRHGGALGRYLKLAGQPLISKNWGDTVFRKIRYAFGSMELWTTPVIMVETIALIYYRAIHDATQSRVLRAICRQILRDEGPHIRFQYERLAILYKDRSWPLLMLTRVSHRALFLCVCLAVWAGHRKAFRAGRYSFKRFWKTAWRKMNFAWRLSEPGNYFRKATAASADQAVVLGAKLGA